MTFTLTLDSRESYLKRELESINNLEFTTSQLDIGDLIISNKSFTFIFERKTWSDLYSSIVSSRFREQRSRLLMVKSNQCFIFYIIEGENKLDSKKTNITKGAIENLMLFHNIPIFYTDSVKHTALKVEKWFTKIQKQKWEKLENNDDNDNDDNDNKNNNKIIKISPSQLIIPQSVKKKYNITTNMFFHQLNLIPGISSNISERIVKEYPTVFSLISKYIEIKDVKERELLLSNIQLDSRKLGKVLSSRIYTTFTNLE